jgi:hypothetical protein
MISASKLMFPQDHLLRQIAKVLDLSDVRQKLAP